MKALFCAGIVLGALVAAYVWAHLVAWVYRDQVYPDGALASLAGFLTGWAAIGVGTFVAIVAVAAA